MPQSRESHTELTITWEGGFVTKCFSPMDPQSVSSNLGNPRIKVQSGLDGPADTVVVVSSARYIVLKELNPTYAEDLPMAPPLRQKK